MGRKSHWKTETTAIRVPAKYADRLVAQAKFWEAQEPDFVQKNEPSRSVLVSLSKGSAEKSKVISAPESVWTEAAKVADQFLDTTDIPRKELISFLPGLFGHFVFNE